MKKIIGLILALAMAISLIGCRTANNETKSRTARVYRAPGTATRSTYVTPPRVTTPVAPAATRAPARTLPQVGANTAPRTYQRAATMPGAGTQGTAMPDAMTPGAMPAPTTAFPTAVPGAAHTRRAGYGAEARVKRAVAEARRAVEEAESQLKKGVAG